MVRDYFISLLKKSWTNKNGRGVKKATKTKIRDTSADYLIPPLCSNPQPALCLPSQGWPPFLFHWKNIEEMESKFQSMEIPVDLSSWRNDLCSHTRLVSPFKDHSCASKFCLCNPCPLHYQLPSGFLSPTQTYKHLIALIKKKKDSPLIPGSSSATWPFHFLLEGSCLPVYVFCFYFLVQFPPCPLQTSILLQISLNLTRQD